MSFALISALHGAIKGLSLPRIRLLAGAAGDLLRMLDRPSRRQEMARRLSEIYPQLSPSDIRRIIREVYRWLFISMADSLHFHRLLLAGRAREHLELVNESGRPLPESGRGVIFASGHFGWWEISCMAMGVFGYPGVVIARKMRNPLLEEYVARLRETQGVRQMPKEGALRPALKALKEGRSLAVMTDQDARYHGIFVDFLGKPASTYPSPAQLAIAAGAPVVFLYCLRKGESDRYRIVIKDIIYPDRRADRQEEIRRITQRLADNLAGMVRAYPDRWLWLHRRWKTYPGKYDDKGKKIKSKKSTQSTRSTQSTARP